MRKNVTFVVASVAVIDVIGVRQRGQARGGSGGGQWKGLVKKETTYLGRPDCGRAIAHELARSQMPLRASKTTSQSAASERRLRMGDWGDSGSRG